MEIQPTPWMANRRGSLVEYRYDALGRRVLVRTTRDGVCVGGGTEVDCTSGIERFVYAGDNVLWEMRGPGSSSSTPAELDQEVGTGQEYGAIGYTHAGGVDRPLTAYKLGVNGAVIAPHTNWRGQFSGGTYLQGSPSTAPVSWPGYSTTAWYQGQPPQEQNRVYMGTVLEGQRDASGQMYKRNRFYDPQTGQFTQTDPIGIAGGLNTYGFAEGDPVTYSDPYGLSADTIPDNNLTKDEAFAHYKSGSGEPIQVPFSSINTSNVTPRTFAGFNRTLRTAMRSGRSQSIQVDERQAYGTSGEDWAVYGNITLRMQGTLSVSCGQSCSWSFSGTLKAFDDVYDFNASNHRGLLGELLTAYGRNTEGKPFGIAIRGSKPIQARGN